MDAKGYLETLEMMRIKPNWWCSKEYFEKAGLVVMEKDGQLIVTDPAGDLAMFPPINKDQSLSTRSAFWADFVGAEGEEFLDHEYLYDPRAFLEMKGGDWAVFRKNSRKFPARVGEELEYIPLSSGDFEASIQEIVLEWAGRLEVVEDAETMISFLFHGENRKALVGRSGKVYGVNVWDENYLYVNFRYSVCPPVPFLAEYLRLLFYRDVAGAGKVVNDGGDLGRESLREFKLKLNPISIREVKGVTHEGEEKRTGIHC